MAVSVGENLRNYSYKNKILRRRQVGKKERDPVVLRTRQRWNLLADVEVMVSE